MRQRLKTDIGPLELTPLVDVLFLLLIFLVLSRAKIQQAVKVALPELEKVTRVAGESAVITVTADNRVCLKDRLVTQTELAKHVTEWAQEGRAVYLVSDRLADMGVVMEIWDLCRASGIRQLSIAADQKAGQEQNR